MRLVFIFLGRLKFVNYCVLGGLVWEILRNGLNKMLVVSKIDLEEEECIVVRILRC